MAKKRITKIKTLNKDHAKLLSEYITKIDETVYHATEGLNSYRYESFENCKKKGIEMSNGMGESYIDEDLAEEWIVTLPNFLIFSVLGFISGIKTEENEDMLDDLTEELYEFHVRSIETLNDIGRRFEVKTEPIFKTRTVKKK